MGSIFYSKFTVHLAVGYLPARHISPRPVAVSLLLYAYFQGASYASAVVTGLVMLTGRRAETRSERRKGQKKQQERKEGGKKKVKRKQKCSVHINETEGYRHWKKKKKEEVANTLRRKLQERKH